MRYYKQIVSAAQMPGSCRYAYVRLAVIEVVSPDHGSRIDAREEGVVRVVAEWGPVPAYGMTARSARVAAEAEAAEVLARLRHEALVEEAREHGGVVEGDELVVQTLDGERRVALAEVVS